MSIELEEVNMNQPLALNAALATSTSERKSEPRLWLVCFFIIAVGIVAIAALTLDGSLSLGSAS